METWTLLLTLLAGFLGIYYSFFGMFKKFEKLGILHLKPLPIFGNTASALFRRRPIVDVITDAYNLNRDAEYVGFYDFTDPIIIARTPNLIKDITVKYFDHFVDHRGLVNAKTDPLFGKNLFALRGDKWKEMRSLLSPSFTGSKMKGMFVLMSNCGKDFADYFAERSGTKKPHVLDVKDAFTRYTNDVIATCAFGIVTDSMRNPKNEFYMLGRKTTKMEGSFTVKLFLLGGFPELARLFGVTLIDPIAARFFENIVKETIERRDRQGSSRSDMIQLMMETRNNKIGDGPTMTIQDMAAQAFGFFFAGFDTSSAFMCFLAHEIAINDDIQARLQDEIDAVLENNNGDVTYETILKMEYFDAVVNEALRKYPGAPFLDRICVKRFQLPPALQGGKSVFIEPGTTVWCPIFAIHRDPKYYSEPEKFDPERFTDGRRNDIDPFTYFPFGLGPRMCIGYRFALLETKVMFFYLLAKCSLRRCSKTVVPIRISKGSFGLTAEGGFWLQIENRNKTVCRKESSSTERSL